MAESIKVDQFLDLGWETQKHRIHNVRQVSGQRLHIITGLSNEFWRHPMLVSSEEFHKDFNCGSDPITNHILPFQ